MKGNALISIALYPQILRKRHKVIQIVSAVEGLARSLAVHLTVLLKKSQIDSAYKNVKNKNAVQVLEYICELEGLSPEETFRELEIFRYAVKYRNLLIHECTLLGEDKYPQLISSANSIFDKLIELYKM